MERINSHILQLKSNVKYRTIYLDYNYVDGLNTYHVNDSLFFVDSDMKFEEFVIQVI